MLPLGLLYVAGIIERCGHQAKILDPYLYDIKHNEFEEFNFEKIFEVIEEYSPAIIGYGGIATSYGRTKKISSRIKANYPEIFQIAGGPLSSTYELLLQKTAIDLVFHGETEISLPIFLSEFVGGGSHHAVPGVSYLQNGQVSRIQSAEQIKDLDLIPFPQYDLINVYDYLHKTEDLLGSQQFSGDDNLMYETAIKAIGSRSWYIPIITSRGCTHKCLFCYRHFKGIRRHSVEYVINHIKYLKHKNGIEGFQFVDELFNSSEAWVNTFCDAIERENLNIFYLIGGARVDKINDKMLRRLKETGCIEINYGQESGSDIILKEYGKGVDSNLNKKITSLTRSIGLNCPVQLVIGSPSETRETINETINFLKEVNACRYSLNYLIPLPETRIWKYVEEKGLIGDVEEYLDRVAEHGGAEPLINLTSSPLREWRRWAVLIRKEMQLYHYKNISMIYYYYYKILYGILGSVTYFVSKETLKKYLPNWLRLWFRKLQTT